MSSNVNPGRYIKRSDLPIALLSVIYFAVLSLYFGHPPIWDERFFYEGFILNAQAKPFDILNYSGNHNGQLWLLLSGLPNYLFPYNYYAYHVWVALLSTAGLIAFYFIVTLLSGGPLGTIERILLTALLAFHPSVLSSQIHVTMDTGLLILWLWFLLALLKEKTTIASIIGCIFLFTKEPAMAHLVIIFTFCSLLKPKAARMEWAKRHIMSVVIPFSAMALFLAYKVLFLHAQLFFHGFLQQNADYIHVFPDNNLIIYVLMAFVLNFNWVVLLLGIFMTLQLYRTKGTELYAVDRQQTPAFTWLILSTLFIVLGVRHWQSVRYLLPLFPAMFLCISHLLPTIQSRKLRVTVLISLLAAFGFQNFRSIDPVSNTVFCTTKFGQHNVLHLIKQNIFGADSGIKFLPKDQLVYNLEFTKVPLLISRIMKDVRPDDNTIFIMHPIYTVRLFTRLDENYDPTFTDAGVMPKILSIWQLKDAISMQTLPDTLYYIEFPTPENALYRQLLSEHYAKVTEKIYDDDGYQLTVLRYEQKK